MRLALSLAAAGLIAGCAQSPAETARAEQREQATADALQRQLAGLTPGEAQTCLPLSFVSSGASTKGYGRTILYTAGRNLIYRNDTTGGCEGVGRGNILVTRQLEGRACRGDIATTVEPTTRTVTGSCALGDFVPYRRAR